jgi:hypothetical protein
MLQCGYTQNTKRNKIELAYEKQQDQWSRAQNRMSEIKKGENREIREVT